MIQWLADAIEGMEDLVSHSDTRMADYVSMISPSKLIQGTRVVTVDNAFELYRNAEEKHRDL